MGRKVNQHGDEVRVIKLNKSKINVKNKVVKPSQVKAIRKLPPRAPSHIQQEKPSQS